MKDYHNHKILEDVIQTKPILWMNPNKLKVQDAMGKISFTYEDIMDADERLKRFAPLIQKMFPETGDGIIESPLFEASKMKTALENKYGKEVKGSVFLKCDNLLKIAGSIKARGGIYEVLKHAEDLVLENNMLSMHDDYSILAEKEFRDFFSQYSVVAGSTGNLGISIGITAYMLGFNTIIHMSYDAKEWKKDLLKKLGVTVVEHSEDFERAVEQGRKQCSEDSNAYFIDDEHSKHLFLGYSVAALRLQHQFSDLNIRIDKDHPLNVYIPCGVGGAPGGIMFGLKHVYGDNVHCYFVEPTFSPCMLLGLLTQKFDEVHVKDYGIVDITEADGLAVGCPSELASRISDKLLDGIYTIEDNELFQLLALLKDAENIKVEPSSATALKGPVLIDSKENSTHLCWMTGGLLLPDEVYQRMYERGKIC